MSSPAPQHRRLNRVSNVLNPGNVISASPDLCYTIDPTTSVVTASEDPVSKRSGETFMFRRSEIPSQKNADGTFTYFIDQAVGLVAFAPGVIKKIAHDSRVISVTLQEDFDDQLYQENEHAATITSVNALRVIKVAVLLLLLLMAYYWVAALSASGLNTAPVHP